MHCMEGGAEGAGKSLEETHKRHQNWQPSSVPLLAFSPNPHHNPVMHTALSVHLTRLREVKRLAPDHTASSEGLSLKPTVRDYKHNSRQDRRGIESLGAAT